MKVVLNNVAFVIVLMISGDGVGCVKITVANYWLFYGPSAWLLFCFIILPLECRGCAMPEGATTATRIVTWNSSGFQVILSCKYDVVIINIHARTELYFTAHKPLSCELNIYHVSCMNHVCCAHYTVISTLCIFRIHHNLRTNLFISSFLTNV